MPSLLPQSIFKRFASSIGAALLLTSLVLSPAAESTSRAETIPALADASQYEIPADSAKFIALTQRLEMLAVNLRSFTKGTKAQIRLKEPLLLPEWADGFVFSANNAGGGADTGFTFHLLVNDANGQTFLYKTESLKVPHRVQYFPNQVKARPIRFSTPGLERPVLVPAAEGNIEAVGERMIPKPPYRIAGLQIESVAFHPSKGQEESPFEFYLSNFAFTHLSRKGSHLYYALDGEERFGELDPVPTVSLGQLGPHYGEAFSVSWEVRDRYDGQPFLTGGKEFTFKENSPGDPQIMSQTLAIPVTERGTYWIHMNRRWSQKADIPTQQIDEYEFRLDILNGKESIRRAPIAETEMIPNSAIRISPDRKSMVFAATEPFIVKTVFSKPKNVAATWRIEVRSVNAEEVIKRVEGTFAAGEAMPGSIALDLNDMPASSYRCRAELLIDGKPIDRTERIVGRKSADKAGAGIPASIPSWQKMLGSSQSFVYLQAHLDEPDPAKRWERMRAFLDQVPEVTTKIEYLFRWRDVEPLPGVYDWSEIDRVLAHAHTKGITALLWPSIVGAEPEWLPSTFEEPRNVSGSIFGAPAYLFHGGRLNLWHAAAIREPALRFLSAVAARYRSNPAVHGYYILTEHPGDSPVHNWLIGGSFETQENFRKHLKQAFPKLDGLNQRWQTRYSAWSEIGVPPEGASALHRLDWLAFLRDAIGAYLVDAVNAIRKVDSHRLIQVYLDGVDPKTAKQLGALGCMVSDGGSQYPETFGGESMGFAEYGLQRRAEEVSVGQWSAMFPTQLDATMFTMLLGGGANSNIKMFIPAIKSFAELRQPPYSLDRFEKLLPIWNELRSTRPMPREAFTLFDRNAQLLEGGTTQFFGDSWATAVCMEAGLTAPWVPLDLAKKGKMIFLPRSVSYEKPVIDGLASYVKGGGTVVMPVDAGRRAPEMPQEDWVLLREFGFLPPLDKGPNTDYVDAAPASAEVFPRNTLPFRLREFWVSPDQKDQQVIATFQSDAKRPAITWKPFGKGRIVIVWASTIVPANAEGYPLLRDIARWAGVTIHGEGEPASLWTNLLSDEAKDRFYGLVYRSSYPGGSDGRAIDGVTRWHLPAGEYNVTELITGREIGMRTAAALKAEGLAAKFNPYEVAVYRIEKASPR